MPVILCIRNPENGEMARSGSFTGARVQTSARSEERIRVLSDSRKRTLRGGLGSAVGPPPPPIGHKQCAVIHGQMQTREIVYLLRGQDTCVRKKTC